MSKKTFTQGLKKLPLAKTPYSGRSVRDTIRNPSGRAQLKDPNTPGLTVEERDRRLLLVLERAFKAAKGA